MTKIFSLLLLIAVFSSCSKSILKDNVYGYPKPEEMEKLFNEKTHGEFGVSSFYNALCQAEQMSCVDYYRTTGIIRDALDGSPGIDAGTFLIDGREVRPRTDALNGGFTYAYTDNTTLQTQMLAGPLKPETYLDLSYLSNVFGNSAVPIALVKEGKTILQGTMTVPQEIRWLSPIQESSSNQYFTRELDFNITWNKDESNSLGVLVRISDDNKMITLHSKDDGIENIKEAMTEFSPSSTDFYIELVRGNVAIIEGTDGKKYKIYFQTSSQIRLMDR